MPLTQEQQDRIYGTKQQRLETAFRNIEDAKVRIERWEAQAKRFPGLTDDIAAAIRGDKKDIERNQREVERICTT